MGELKDRKFKRIESLNLVSFTHFDKNMRPDSEGAARTLDISVNGILLEFYQEFEKGTFFEMEIAIHDVIINAKGKVMRCQKQEKEDKFEIGIQFIEITNEDRNLIADFLKN